MDLGAKDADLAAEVASLSMTDRLGWFQAKVTHFITDTIHCEYASWCKSVEYDSVAEPDDLGPYAVTPKWAHRSIALRMPQPVHIYSPDPSCIFSGIVICCAHLSPHDTEMLSSAVTSLGGGVRQTLCEEVTHVVATSRDSGKMMALELHTDLPIIAVAPHWINDSYSVRRLLPLDGYVFDMRTPGALPPCLCAPPPMSPTSKEFSDSAPVSLLSEQVPPHHDDHTVLAGKTVLLARDIHGGTLESLPHLHSVRDRIVQAGGQCAPILKSDASPAQVRAAVQSADIVVARHRESVECIQALRHDKVVGTLGWLVKVLSSGRLTSPRDRILHFPYPHTPVAGFPSLTITITNYRGTARTYLKELIAKMGGIFTPEMCQTSSICVALDLHGEKVTKAREWNIPIVNHIWLENCFATWKNQNLAQRSFITFPGAAQLTAVLGQVGVSDESIAPFMTMDSPSMDDSGPIDTHSNSVSHSVVQNTPSRVPERVLSAAPESNWSDSTDMSHGNDDTHRAIATSTTALTAPTAPTDAAADATHQDVGPLDSGRSFKAEPDSIEQAGAEARHTASSIVSDERREEAIQPVSERDPSPAPEAQQESAHVDESKRILEPYETTTGPEPREDSLHDHVPTSGFDESSLRHSASSEKASGSGPEAHDQASKPGSSTPLSVQERASTDAHVEQMVESNVSERSGSASPVTNEPAEMASPSVHTHPSSRSASTPMEADSERTAAPSHRKRATASKATAPLKRARASSPANIVVATTSVDLSATEQRTLQALGIQRTDDMSKATHLVAKNLTRTEKMLCAIARGLYIVGMSWIRDMTRKQTLIDASSYTLRDKDKEKQWSMSLADVLERSRQAPSSLLRGHTFYVSKHVQPSREILRHVMEAAGAHVEYVTAKTNADVLAMDQVHVIGSRSDQATLSSLRAQHEKRHSSKDPTAPVPWRVYTPELVLSGILRQHVDWSATYELSVTDS